MPKTPKLNGLAERMNQTIMERVRNMLAHAKLPKTFWAEALMKAVYVINKSPSVILDGDVPPRVWTGRDISYWHLRVFDCLSYIHVAKNTFAFTSGRIAHSTCRIFLKRSKYTLSTKIGCTSITCSST